jgi:hypothetical protein
MSQRYLAPTNLFYNWRDPLPPDFPDPNTGDIYFNTVSQTLRVYYEDAWHDAVGAGGGSLDVTDLADQLVIPLSEDFVQKTGDTMSGDLTVVGGAVTGFRGGKVARYASASNTTGALLIRIGHDLMTGMNVWTLKGYEYVTGKGEFTITIGGYCYSGNPTAYWVNNTIRIDGADRNVSAGLVRLMAKGGTAAGDQEYAIVIGDTTTVWQYPNLHVWLDVGFNPIGVEDAVKAVSVELATNLSEWTWTQTPTPEIYATKTYVNNKMIVSSNAASGTPAGGVGTVWIQY